MGKQTRGGHQPAQELLNERLWQYQPQEDRECDQLAFHRSDARVRLIQAGTGSGKTTATMAEIAAFAAGPPYPPWFARGDRAPDATMNTAASKRYKVRIPNPKQPLKIWLCMQQLPQDIESCAPLAKLLFGEFGNTEGGLSEVWMEPLIPKRLQGVYNKNKNTIRVNGGGALIEVKSANQKTSAFEGPRVDMIVVDEPIETRVWRALLGRLIRTPTIFCVIGLTPYSNNLGWIQDLHDRLERQQNSMDSSQGAENFVEIFRFNTLKNKYLAADQAEEIKGSTPAHHVEMRFRGDLIMAGGRVYPHVFKWMHPDADPLNTGNFVKPFKIPSGDMWFDENGVQHVEENWTRYVVHDPGVANPAAAAWCAVAPSGDIYVYKVMYIENPGVVLKPIADTMLQINGDDRIRRWYIDPFHGARRVPTVETMLSDPIKEKTIVDLYKVCGIHFQLGPRKQDRAGRMERAQNLQLWLDPKCTKVPMMYFFNPPNSPEMEPLKREFRLFVMADTGRESENRDARETTRSKHDHLMYCIETMAALPVRFVQTMAEHKALVTQSIEDALKSSAKAFWNKPFVRRRGW